MSRLHHLGCAVACLAALAPLPAGAVEMGSFGIGVRFGYSSPSLAAGDVPVFGSELQKKFDEANAAVDRYNASTGGHRPHYDISEMNLDQRMLLVVPTLHFGGDGFFTKLEVPMRFSSDLFTIGLGFYPLAYGYLFESAGLFPYLSAGAVVSYAKSSQFTASGGQTTKTDAAGAMIEPRLTAGLKVFLVDHFPISVEAGWSPYALGAVIDSSWQAPTGTTWPDNPALFARGGRGMVFDLTAGVEWL